MSSLERQFEDGQEVYEMTQTPGYQLIKATIEERIQYTDNQIKDLISNVQGNTNAQELTQELIKLQSYRSGLIFIINEVDYAIQKRDSANNKLK